MRVTMNTMYSQINMDLSRLTERLANLTDSISSGKQYQVPSDAPVKLTHALELRDSLAETEQYKRDISYGNGWVMATENVMTHVTDRLTRAKELAVQAANDTQNAGTRRAIAQEIKAILEEVVSLGNTKLGDRFIMAGTRTTGYPDGERPFVMDRDMNVTYHGNQEDITLDVSSGKKQKINLDGKTSLMESGSFQALKDLYDSLMANSQPNIENALGKIDQSINYVSDKTSELGAMANSLEVKDEMADSIGVINRQVLSDVEDTDMIEAINSLNATQTAYQAALGAASKVMQVTLADYL
jgi:flagellar hook-associated protein 3 FlgL